MREIARFFSKVVANGRDADFQSTTTKTYVVALSLVATLSVAAYLTMHGVIRTLSFKGAIINVSGRQRMLSQRISLYSEYLSRAEPRERDQLRETLMELVDRFASAHRDLTLGSAALGVPSESVKSVYFDEASALNADVSAFVSRVYSLLKVEAEGSRKYGADLAAIHSLQAKLLPKLDRVVSIHQAESEVQVARLQMIESLILVFTLLLLAIEACFIFRPMVRSIARLLDAAADAREKAVKAADDKSAFLATITHEIRTPMTGVLGITEALLETDLPVENRDQVETLQRLSETLVSMVNDILDYSKIEAGHLTLEAVDFNLPVVAKDTEILFRPSAVKKGVNLFVMVDPGLPEHVRGDPTRLRQVVTNFLSNAIKFTPSGGRIDLSMKLIAGPGPGSRIRIEVRDSGGGISGESRARIFQRYSQADASISRKFGGTGLGLAICKQISDVMGGSIGFDSEDGRGTTFWFELTLAPTPGLTAQPAVAIKAPANWGSGLSVLLVDDNLVNQKIIGAQLSRLGFTVQWAENGREAVKAAANAAFDLVLMDCEMPEMDGFEASREIRKLEERNQLSPVPILAMTGHSADEFKQRCFESGMSAFMTKPIRRELLESKLQEWLPETKVA